MNNEEQISIKDILLKIIAFKNLIVKNWLLLIVLGLLGASAGYAFDYFNKTDTTYTSRISIYLENAQPQNEMGGYAALLGMQQPQSNGLFNGENLNILVMSYDFVSKVMLKEVDVFGMKKIMANYFYEKSKTKKDLEDEAKLKAEKKPLKYKPLSHTVKSKFTLDELNSLDHVISKVNPLTFLNPIPGTSFLMVEVETVNDTLSKIYGETFLETLKEYYLQTKMGKLYTTMNKQQDIVDSLRYVLQANENSLARVQDQNSQVTVFETNRVNETRLKNKTQLITEAYREQERVLNTLKFQSYQEQPLFKITTPQRLPIEPNKSKLGSSIKSGAIIAIFLGIVFLIIRKTFKAVLAEK